MTQPDLILGNGKSRAGIGCMLPPLREECDLPSSACLGPSIYEAMPEATWENRIMRVKGAVSVTGRECIHVTTAIDKACELVEQITSERSYRIIGKPIYAAETFTVLRNLLNVMPVNMDEPLMSYIGPDTFIEVIDRYLIEFKAHVDWLFHVEHTYRRYSRLVSMTAKLAHEKLIGEQNHNLLFTTKYRRQSDHSCKIWRSNAEALVYFRITRSQPYGSIFTKKQYVIDQRFEAEGSHLIYTPSEYYIHINLTKGLRDETL